MQDRQSLRIGCVEYLNARPLIRGWDGPVDFASPSLLCERLARGDLDVALVSSFEFLRNPIYRIVDGVSITSDGPVYSVVVAHHGDAAEIRSIELDPASETSVALLRYVLAQRNLNPALVPRSTAPDGAARLLIGDQAIRLRQSGSDLKFWDLGAEWKRIVGLPFVYALWLVRPEVANAELIAERLRSLRDRNWSQIDQVVAEQTGFGREFCARYYTEHLRFGLGEREKSGLRSFAHGCAKLGLITQADLSLALV